MSDYTFNDDILNFRLLPKNLEEVDYERDVVCVYKLIDTKKAESLLIDLHGGLRSKVDANRTRQFYCVICDLSLSNSKNITTHIANDHNDLCELFRKSPVKPIVGLDQIEEYIDEENNKPVEYKCNLCDLIYSPKNIFWHIVSFDHKENFFKTKFSIDFIDQIKDGRLKHEKIDKALIVYEKENPDRGRFQRKIFKNGMISSHFGIKNRMNMPYIQRLYPQQTGRVQSLQRFLPHRPKFDISIQSDQQFDEGKSLLQNINQALMEFQAKMNKN